MRSQANFVLRLLSAGDCLLLAVILAAVWAPIPLGDFLSILPLLLALPYWVFLLQFFGIYESQRLDGTTALIRKILSVQVTGGATMAAVILLLGQPNRLVPLSLFLALGTAMLIVGRAVLYPALGMLRRRGYNVHHVCVIGSWESAARIHARFSDNPHWGLKVACAGIGSPEKREYVHFPTGDRIAASLEDLLRTNVIDEIHFELPAQDLPRERETMWLCAKFGVLGRVKLETVASESAQPELELHSGEPSITVGKVPGDGPAAVWKRVFDLVFTLLCLVLLSPVMLLSALLVKVYSPGPIFFRQRRAGVHGRPFIMYKFRSMVDGAEGGLRSLASRSITDGPAFKDRTDVRVTSVGRMLRRFSIDELPQLLNVLKGEMSLVGPRPLPLHEAAQISGIHRRRFSMRPGITCLWQVNGRSDVPFSEWMSYDLQYVDSWSLWLDAKLLVRTIPAVLSGKGAY